MKSSQPSPSNAVRLNKFIAQSGVASRRKADLLISAGKVSVNGRVVRDLGVVVNPIKDQVVVDGNTIKSVENKSYIAFYKPKGVLCSMSGPGETLEGFMAEMKAAALFHVGRLDRESEGLLLITNDGDWANGVVHPRYEVSKEYILELAQPLSQQDYQSLLAGLELEDGFFRADQVSGTGSKRVRVVIHDGRNRILRRVFAHLDYEVKGLQRIRIGGVHLGKMRPGEWKEIDPLSINR